MAHLVYKKPLLDERVRTRYIGAVRELEVQRKDRIIDGKEFKVQKNKLFVQTKGIHKELFEDEEDGEPIKKKKSRRGELDGLMDGNASVRSSDSASSTGKTTKTTKKGTIFDRNDIGRLVFKENARTEDERKQLKEQKREQERLLARLQLLEMEGSALGISYDSPEADEMRRCTSPASNPSRKSSVAAPPKTPSKRRNFLFFRWGNSGNSAATASSSDSCSDAVEIIDSIDETTPPIPTIPQFRNIASPIAEKSSIPELRPIPPRASDFPDPPMAARRARSSSTGSRSIQASSLVTFNTAFLSIPRTRNSKVGETEPRLTSTGRSERREKTLADFFLVPPSAGKNSEYVLKKAFLRAASTAGAIDALSLKDSDVASIITTRTSTSLQRRRSASMISAKKGKGTGEITGNYTGFNFNFTEKSRKREHSMYIAPDLVGVLAGPSSPGSPGSPTSPTELQVPATPAVPSSSGGSSKKTSSIASSAQISIEESDLRGRIMAKITLDFFTYFNEEFNSVSNLFDYARRNLSFNDEEQSHRRSMSSSVIRSANSSTRSFPIAAANSSISGEKLVEEDEIERIRDEVQRKVWYLCAKKWLGFGRVLFSPAHHLMSIVYETSMWSSDDMVETRILDLDPYEEGGWAWQCCFEYPQAQVFSITTSPHIHRSWLSHPHRPSNHTLLLASPKNLLSPFPPASFDVISTRRFPSLLPPTPQNLSTSINSPDWPSLLPRISSLLKTTGFFELLVIESSLDPPSRGAYPLTTSWISQSLHSPSHGPKYHPNPSNPILQMIAESGGFSGVRKCRVWMPALDGGDELSCVTSRLGRGMYEKAFGEQCAGLWRVLDAEARGGGEGPGFRWVKCFAGKA